MLVFANILSKLTIPQFLRYTFSSSPRLPTPFRVCMDALRSHSPFPHLQSHPLSAQSFSPWLIPSYCNCFSSFPSSTHIKYYTYPPHTFSYIYVLQYPCHSRRLQIHLGTCFAVVFSSHTYNFPLPPESSICYRLRFATHVFDLFFILHHLYRFLQRNITHTIHTPHQLYSPKDSRSRSVVLSVYRTENS